MICQMSGARSGARSGGSITGYGSEGGGWGDQSTAPESEAPRKVFLIGYALDISLLMNALGREGSSSGLWTYGVPLFLAV